MEKWGVGLIPLLAATSVMAKNIRLFNVSYDPTRELYEQCDKTSSAHWKQQTGDNVVIRQSHDGSGKQTTSVINGIEANVVTLALAYNMDTVTEHGRVNEEWIKHLPNNSAPYTPAVIFLICKGNPKQIHDWDDLIKPGVSVIAPNPKSSGGARWDQLAAWGYVLRHNNNDQTKAQNFVRALYKNVKALDSDTRGSANTFVERGVGDVLIAWGNEALLAANELGKNKFEIVTPSEPVPAESTVSAINKVVEKKGTKEVAETYLEYLYPPEGQEAVAGDYYCPCDAEVAKKYENAFPKLKLFAIDKELGGWTKARKEHFANGGTLDQISRR